MSSHFYHPVTGELVGGLREARPVNALPSPTTVLSLIKGEGLLKYFQRQMWEATITTPRQSNWTDDQFYEACAHWADEHAKQARERGGDFHDLCQKFHLAAMGGGAPIPAIPSTLVNQFEAYLLWYEKYVQKTLAVEQFVVGQGYAGRRDHVALLKDGRVACMDTKTQALAANRKSFRFYPEWGLQLGAYAGANPPSTEPIPIDVLINVVVESHDGRCIDAQYWPHPPVYYHGLFLNLLSVWNEAHNYWPKPELLNPLAPSLGRINSRSDEGILEI